MGKIQFGMPTLIELNSLQSCISFCKQWGLSFIEINMNMPQYQVELLNINEMKEAIEQGIYFTFHLDENTNVCDFNPLISKAYCDTVLATIYLAKEINAPIINLHMPEGVYFTLPDKKVYLFDQYKETYLLKLQYFREICTNAMGKANIKICLENCDGYKSFSKEGIQLLLESNAFGLTFDIGHSYSAKNIDERFIMERKNKLVHMHIHDAKALKNHLILGTGEINLVESLSLAKEINCRCVIETKTVKGLQESIKYLNQIDCL